MTPFIIAAVAITLVTLVILILPLLRTPDTVSYERHAQNIHYAKERLEELEEQLKNASISATDYEALKSEIETTLAHDIDIANNPDNTQTNAPKRSNKLAIGLLTLFLPISALGFYLVVGTPEALELSTQAGATQDQDPQKQIQELVSDLEKRLEETPNDLQGWQLLSQTYLTIGRYRDAQKGFQQVLRLGGDSAHTYASLADATALAVGGEINQEVSGYIKKALSLNPNNRQALWLAGLEAAQKGDKPTAKIHWERLVPLLDDAPQQQQELLEIIKSNFGDDDSISKVASAELEPASESKSEAAPLASPPSNGQPKLTIFVSLGEEIASLADSRDFVFIFAKAAQGPPAPLAVKRLTVADLPIVVTLSDADAMVPAMTLSKFSDVVISARVSKSGQPIAQPGDLESDITATKNTASEAIKLTINNVVE